MIRHESKSVIPNITFTYQYFNDKGLIVEEKIYRKEGSGKEAKLVLKEWIIKKYDAFDKLIEEKFKQAFEDSNGVKIKRVYEYDPTTQKLLKITTYAVIEFYEKEDLQRIQDITNFTYDNLGRLTSKSFSDEFYHHKYESQHYKYKAGKLWVQETWSNGGDTIIDIYKEGKLVRKKLYNSLDTKSPYWIIDYQYVYD